MEGRWTAGRAALIGAGAGVVIGALLVSVVAVGALFGAVSGALVHEALSGGRRDFMSFTRIEADRYDVQVDPDAAGEAKRLLDDMPAGRSG